MYCRESYDLRRNFTYAIFLKSNIHNIIRSNIRAYKHDELD